MYFREKNRAVFYIVTCDADAGGNLFLYKTCLAGDVLRSGLQAEISWRRRGMFWFQMMQAGRAQRHTGIVCSSVKIPIPHVHGIRKTPKKKVNILYQLHGSSRI